MIRPTVYKGFADELVKIANLAGFTRANSRTLQSANKLSKVTNGGPSLKPTLSQVSSPTQAPTTTANMASPPPLR